MLFIAITLFCAMPAAVPAEQVLKIGGVGSALATMQLLGEAFERAHPGVKVKILPSIGSSGAIKAVVEGAIDIGLSGRPLKEEERGKGALQTEYARTPFVFVTNRSTKAANITTKDLVEIYEGKKQTWQDGTRIRLVLRPESDTDTNILKSISPDVNRAVKAAYLRQGLAIGITNQESDDLVESISGSLGISSLTQVISERRSEKVLSFNGTTPSVLSLENGTYPLVKPLYLVTASGVSAGARQFITFVFSPAGRKILSENGNLASARGTGTGK
jgi:phosphate transport system substrate-binding protein